MGDWFLKNIVAIILALVSFVSIYAVNNYRINALEEEQNKQDGKIMVLQSQQVEAIANYAALAAKLDAVNDTVNYVRDRIDAALK